MVPAIPQSIKLEHHKLHKDLTKLIGVGGKVGQASRGVAAALHKHFGKEEKYAMPPLGVLVSISKGKKVSNSREVIRLTLKLEKLLPEMLKEHKAIIKRLNILEKAAKKEKNKEALAFVKNLKLHAETEEEILYPAAILTGKYLKTL